MISSADLFYLETTKNLTTTKSGKLPTVTYISNNIMKIQSIQIIDLIGLFTKTILGVYQIYK